MIGAGFTRTRLISARKFYSTNPLTGLLCSEIICLSQYVMWIL
uniref:NADK3 n=1 Tax=Arundo donax TaxID=35708 RepID=A0A0A9GZ87_ARUDO